MKRYRILSFDFDSRSYLVDLYRRNEPASDQDKNNLTVLMTGLKYQFGEENFDNKIKNLLDVGSKPFSIIAYHNYFLEQIRQAFIFGNYYPALTGSMCFGRKNS